MLRIQLWASNLLLEDRTVETSKQADRAIDAILTKVHKGIYGNGPFRIEADHCDPSGQLFQGSYFVQKDIRPARAAAER